MSDATPRLASRGGGRPRPGSRAARRGCGRGRRDAPGRRGRSGRPHPRRAAREPGRGRPPPRDGVRTDRRLGRLGRTGPCFCAWAAASRGSARRGVASDIEGPPQGRAAADDGGPLSRRRAGGGFRRPGPEAVARDPPAFRHRRPRRGGFAGGAARVRSRTARCTRASRAVRASLWVTCFCWAGRVACFQDGAWISYAPRPGWLAWVASEGALFVPPSTGFAGGAARVRSRTARCTRASRAVRASLWVTWLSAIVGRGAALRRTLDV
jgi:hypothetical protein